MKAVELIIHFQYGELGYALRLSGETNYLYDSSFVEGPLWFFKMWYMILKVIFGGGNDVCVFVVCGVVMVCVCVWGGGDGSEQVMIKRGVAITSHVHMTYPLPL